MRFMRRALVLFVLLGLASAAAAQDHPKKRKLLFIGQSKGYQHDSVSTAMATLYNLGRSTALGTPISEPTALPSPKRS